MTGVPDPSYGAVVAHLVARGPLRSAAGARVEALAGGVSNDGRAWADPARIRTEVNLRCVGAGVPGPGARGPGRHARGDAPRRGGIVLSMEQLSVTARQHGKMAHDWLMLNADGSVSVDGRVLLMTDDDAPSRAPTAARPPSRRPKAVWSWPPRCFETGNARHLWLNSVQAVAKGVRECPTLTYKLYQLAWPVDPTASGIPLTRVNPSGKQN